MTGQQWGGNLLPVLRTIGEEKFKIISEHVQIVPNLHVSILETKVKLQYYQESNHYLIMQLYFCNLLSIATSFS